MNRQITPLDGSPVVLHQYVPPISEPLAASLLGMSRANLKRLRHLGKGPTYVRLGPKKIVYFERDITAWLAARTVQAQPPDAPAARARAADAA